MTMQKVKRGWCTQVYEKMYREQCGLMMMMSGCEMRMLIMLLMI